MSGRKFVRRSGCAIVSFDHRMQWVDEPLADMLGYPASELAGKTFESITHPEDVDLDAQLAIKLFSGKLSQYRIEKRFVRKDGSIVRLGVCATTVKDFDGMTLYGLATVTAAAAGAPLDAERVGETETDSEEERIRRAMLD